MVTFPALESIHYIGMFWVKPLCFKFRKTKNSQGEIKTPVRMKWSEKMKLQGCTLGQTHLEDAVSIFLNI